MIETNSVIRAHLAADAGLIALVGIRVYVPRLPENAALPAVGLFTRGGTSTPYIPTIPSPSVQIDCWGRTPQEARQVYRAVYDALQGIQNVTVTIGLTDYVILASREEVQGQDLADELQGYYRVLTFFEVMLR
ncbi:MAG: DUF3168 domain-containing protein [Dehalococcoidales bacterium]|nr:DUF3168 domain-containing protein [Dehalococcoidales bacterium]